MSDRTSNPSRPGRRPWVAGILNAVLAPVGYVYVGELRRGLAVWLAALAASTAGMLLLARPHGALSLGLVIAIPVASWALMAGDAWRLAARKRLSWQPGPANRWFVYLAAAAVALAMSEVVPRGVRTYLVRAYRIPSAAMSPTLLPGDRVLVDNLAYRRRDPARYEVVVFEAPQTPSKFFIKRIVGLPGERIEVKGQRIHINGQARQDYVSPLGSSVTNGRAGGESFGPLQIPDGQYFLLNDNGDPRSDSRSWGTVPRGNILGTARSIYWSWDAAAARIRWDRIGQPIR